MPNIMPRAWACLKAFSWTFRIYVMTPEQVEENDRINCLMTDVTLNIPRIQPEQEDVLVTISTGKRGNFSLNDADILLHPSDSVALTMSGMGMDNENPLPADTRLRPLGFTIDGDTVGYWNGEESRGSFQTDDLDAGEHALAITLLYERYSRIESEEPVPVDTPPEYGWVSLMDDAERRIILDGTFKPAVPDEPDGAPKTGDESAPERWAALALLAALGLCVLVAGANRRRVRFENRQSEAD